VSCFSDVDEEEEEEYDELDHRAANQYWMADSKMKLEEVHVHDTVREGTEQTEAMVISSLAVNKLMR